jgi:hypothetical protein
MTKVRVNCSSPSFLRLVSDFRRSTGGEDLEIATKVMFAFQIIAIFSSCSIACLRSPT